MEFTIRKDAPTHKLNKHWQYCVGSGHATLTLRADYLEQLNGFHGGLDY